MSISQRQQEILHLLEQQVFCSVQHLANVTYTSPSSIRRDLAALERQGLVSRTHGGASLPKSDGRAPSLRDRMSLSVSQKRLIAKKAATLLHDGMSVLLDGSSTASFLLPHLAQFQGIQLFTNSMTTALRAVELGIPTRCLGGNALDHSAVLVGEAACQAVRELYVDTVFFSSQCLDSDGTISDATEEENFLRRQMLRSARHSIFLCDSSKFRQRALHRLANLSEIQTAVFDLPFPELTAACHIL